MELYSSNDEEYKFTDVYDAISDSIQDKERDDWLEVGLIKVFRGDTCAGNLMDGFNKAYGIINVKELTFKITNFDEGTCDFDFEEVVDGKEIK